MNEFFFELKLFFPDSEKALIAFNSIKPELNDFHQKRSKAEIKINKNMFLLEINALDKTALKASVNAYLKQLNLIEELLEVI
ncbi:MAG: CTAG/PCC1 family protein [Candidatus Diapherotrites archaeon]|nr:CTAG/PCC1 family protein [Candidatus Diapherotrites archaeon]